MVADRSDHISLANQYTNSEQINDLSLIQIIKTAQAPLKTSSLGIIPLALFCGLLGLLFAMLLILLQLRLQEKNQEL
jgi:uncharacterized protein involved in exopolysaccharide biosynthesis